MTTSLSGRRQQSRVGGAAINAAIDAGVAAEKAKWDDLNERAKAAREAERERPKLTREDIVGAGYVLLSTSGKWHPVVKVNKVTVTVSGLFPWDEPVRFEKVLRVHA